MTDLNNSNVAATASTQPNQEVVQDIEVISQILSESKIWWKSKMLWVNILTIIGSLTAYFGFDLKAHGINYDALATTITTILGIANIVLRIFSKTTIRILPTTKTENTEK